MTILSICSSRNRPQELERMVNSFYATVENKTTQLVIYVSDDDPKLDLYKKLDTLIQQRIFYGPHKYMVEVLNYFSTIILPNFDFYQEVNDDHIYHTRGWDKILSDRILEAGGWGIACPNTLIDMDFNRRCPSAAMISGNIVRALGYFVYPEVRHIGTDCILQWIGTEINKLIYDKGVVIEHFCWHDEERGIGKRVAPDENIKWVYGDEESAHWNQALEKWKNISASEINKIKKAMEAGL